MWLPIEKPLPIAVDFGFASLRAVQFERKGGGTVVKHWVHQRICPTDAAADGDGDMTTGLSHLKPAGWDFFGGREVVTTIGPPELETCSLRVPSSVLELDHESLLRSIRHEVARQIKSPIESLEMDCWPLRSKYASGANLMIGAVRRDVIDKIIQWTGDNGYICSRIDLSPLSTLRGCMRVMSDLPSDQLWGVLDVGARSSRLYLAVGETPVYVRTLQGGAREMSQRIADELGVSCAVAERYKRHYGIRAEETGYRPVMTLGESVDETRMAAILRSVLSPILHGMAGDIERSFRYGLELYPDLPVNCLVLVGGGAGLDGFDDVLGTLLGLRVRRLSFDQPIGIDANHPMLTDSVLIGMANCLGLGFGALES